MLTDVYEDENVQVRPLLSDTRNFVAFKRVSKMIKFCYVQISVI